MGEIADAMVSGESCELCGSEFEYSHGHPATCWDCWSNLTPPGRGRVQRARCKTL